MYSECKKYERISRKLEDGQLDDVTDEDVRFLLDHEAGCESGRHTSAALETELGIPVGSLKDVSAEHGIPSSQEVADRIRAALFAEDGDSFPSAHEGPGSFPHVGGDTPGHDVF